MTSLVNKKCTLRIASDSSFCYVIEQSNISSFMAYLKKKKVVCVLLNKNTFVDFNALWYVAPQQLSQLYFAPCIKYVVFFS